MVKGLSSVHKNLLRDYVKKMIVSYYKSVICADNINNSDKKTITILTPFHHTTCLFYQK